MTRVGVTSQARQANRHGRPFQPPPSSGQNHKRRILQNTSVQKTTTSNNLPYLTTVAPSSPHAPHLPPTPTTTTISTDQHRSSDQRAPAAASLAERLRSPALQFTSPIGPTALAGHHEPSAAGARISSPTPSPQRRPSTARAARFDCCLAFHRRGSNSRSPSPVLAETSSRQIPLEAPSSPSVAPAPRLNESDL